GRTQYARGIYHGRYGPIEGIEPCIRRIYVRVPAVVRIYVPDTCGTVRIVHSPCDDPFDASVGGSVRAAFDGACGPDTEYLFGTRHFASVWHREKERDPADRSYEHAARTRNEPLRCDN